MSAFELRTISDKEAAERLGFSVRVIRPVLDQNALCLRHGRQRRLTEADFVRLQSLLRPECPSNHTFARTASTTSGGPSRAFASTKAREAELWRSVCDGYVNRAMRFGLADDPWDVAVRKFAAGLSPALEA